MKKGVIIFSAILSVVLLAGMVAAAENILPAPPISMAQLQSFFYSIFTGDIAQAGGLAARVLVFLLLTVLLYKPASKITGNNDNLGLFLSALVSIMAVRFLTPTEIMGFFLPYSAVGITVSIVVPFLLVFWFMETSNINPLYRKFVWIVFGSSFLVLWWNRWGDIGDLAWIYLLAGIVSFIVLLAEGTIRNMMYATQIKSNNGKKAYLQIMDLQKELDIEYKRLAGASSSHERQILLDVIKEHEDDIKALQSQIK